MLWYAVSPASASGATSVGSRPGSILITERAPVLRYCAKPPSANSPGKLLFSQCTSSPSRHARHSPQVMSGCRMTLSPGATFVTASPTASTQPAFSWPCLLYTSDAADDLLCVD